MSKPPSSHHQKLAAVPPGHFAVGIKGTSKWWLVIAPTQRDARKKIEQLEGLPTGTNALRFYRKLPATRNSGVLSA
jgi:hypothetical protein